MRRSAMATLVLGLAVCAAGCAISTNGTDTQNGTEQPNVNVSDGTGTELPPGQSTEALTGAAAQAKDPRISHTQGMNPQPQPWHDDSPTATDPTADPTTTSDTPDQPQPQPWRPAPNPSDPSQQQQQQQQHK